MGIDISKAFDTIPHESITQVLRARCCPDEVVDIIDDMYKDMFTIIKVQEKEINIQLKRGIKQGDSLSPFPFKLVIDDLLQKIQESAECYELNGKKIGVMGYADDLILFAKDSNGANKLVEHVIEYLDKLDMKLSLPKCYATSIKAKNRTWIMEDPHIGIRKCDNEVLEIRNLKIDEPFEYLGCYFTIAQGMSNKYTEQKIQENIMRLDKLRLKPRQKSDLLFTYILPKFYYEWVKSIISKSFLKRLDSSLRIYLKKLFHLNHFVTDNLFYCRRRDGGMGIPKYENVIQMGIIKMGYKWYTSNDEIVKELFIVNHMGKFLLDYARKAGVAWPTNLKVIIMRKQDLKQDEFNEWKIKTFQGKGVGYFHNNKVSNEPFYEMDLLKDSRYIDFLRLRTNTVGTNVAKAIVNPTMDIKCRRCKLSPETTAHIIGQCLANKNKIIHRHNQVVEVIRKELERNPKFMKIEIEKSVEKKGERFRPDITINTGKNKIYVDVSNRFESGDFYNQACCEKREKYKRILEKGDKIVPLIFGTRGAIPNMAINELKKLGITKYSTLKTISMINIRSSIEIINEHIE